MHAENMFRRELQLSEPYHRKRFIVASLPVRHLENIIQNAERSKANMNQPSSKNNGEDRAKVKNISSKQRELWSKLREREKNRTPIRGRHKHQASLKPTSIEHQETLTQNKQKELKLKNIPSSFSSHVFFVYFILTCKDLSEKGHNFASKYVEEGRQNILY